MDENELGLMTDHTKRGEVVGKKCDDFTLKDHLGNNFTLSEALSTHIVLLAFYPGGPIHPICTGQFCEYRDTREEFDKLNVKIYGVSNDPIDKQAKFAQGNGYPFLFLQDSYNKVAKQFMCTSKFMLNRVSRAIVIINQDMILLYRYVEPTVFTRRGSFELINILKDLKNEGLI